MPLSLYSNDPGEVIRPSCNNYNASVFILFKSLPSSGGLFSLFYTFLVLRRKKW
jgi:hypothetical protein